MKSFRPLFVRKPLQINTFQLWVVWILNKVKARLDVVAWSFSSERVPGVGGPRMAGGASGAGTTSGRLADALGAHPSRSCLLPVLHPGGRLHCLPLSRKAESLELVNVWTFHAGRQCKGRDGPSEGGCSGGGRYLKGTELVGQAGTRDGQSGLGMKAAGRDDVPGWMWVG